MVGCDLHGVLKFSQVVGVVPWNLPLRFGMGAVSPPLGFVGGGAFTKYDNFGLALLLQWTSTSFGFFKMLMC